MLHIIDRPLDRGHDVADPSEMDDDVRTLEQGGAGLDVADVRLLEGKALVRRVMREIGLAPADQIVDHPDLVVPTVQEQVHHVAADETGAAGDDGNGHQVAPSFFMVRTL